MIRGASVAAFVVLVSGCACVERRKAQAMSAELRESSRERSVGTMRAAAERHGARLLPDVAQTWRAPNECMGDPFLDSCKPWWLGGGEMFRINDSSGRPHLVVPIPKEDAFYARLAVRGDTLLLLVPRVVREKVDEGTECECDAGLVIEVPTNSAFVIDEIAPVRKLERVTVTVTQDFIDWECKVRLL